MAGNVLVHLVRFGRNKKYVEINRDQTKVEKERDSRYIIWVIIPAGFTEMRN